MSLGRVLAEEFSPETLAWLRERVEVVVVDPWNDPEAWEREAPNVDAVMSRKGRIGREHMEKSAGRLKIIARTGIGVDPSRVDLVAAREHRVWVTNTPGSNSVAVAEMVFGQMIAIARFTHQGNISVRNDRWGDYRLYNGIELAGKTLGIVGMGNIGTRVALRARAFEMPFLVFDPYVPESHAAALGGTWVELDQLLAKSDFVTVHCPSNQETQGMIGARELALMKPTAVVMNLARGGIVEEGALVDALTRKVIAGAVIDVMAQEPPAGDHPLFKLDNVLLTPHIGGSTVESTSRGEQRAAEEVIRVLSGQRPKDPVIQFD